MDHSAVVRARRLVILAVTLSPCCFGFEGPNLSRGQTVCVSVYSNILTAPRSIAFASGSTPIIRNTDTSYPLKVTAARFDDTEGKLVRPFLEAPLILQPFETKYIHLPSTEASGGLGANFIVRWSADRQINMPIAECLMIGRRSGQGIFFISSGKVIQGHGPQGTCSHCCGPTCSGWHSDLAQASADRSKEPRE
ncbi:MAG: DUF3124 domain-containing protein [Ignavibacteria bacterium]|nr:DUF3124 domain-containing protein [Ignavibacteria bacterium]